MSQWHLRHGSWWMLQWAFDGWLSLGVHFDFRTRHLDDGQVYGPYVDVHLGCLIVSVGRNPAYSGSIEHLTSVGRGGLRG